MTAETTPMAKIRNLPDLLGVIPHLLGFHPAESLVVVVLVDGRVELTARADLPDLQPSGHVELLIDRLLLRWPAARVWVVAYSSSESAGWGVLQRAETHLGDALAGEPLCVTGGWYRAGHSSGPRSRHDPSSTQSAATATLHGLQARPSRAELRHSVRADPSRALEAERAWAGAAERAQRLAARDRPAAMASAVAAALAAPGSVPRDDLVWLAMLTRDPDARDRALVAITGDNAETCVELWSRVVRACPQGVQGQPLALLGWAAWVSGDGALQCICLEELELLHESLPLQRLLDQLNQAIVPPSAWNQLRLELVAALAPLDLSQVGADQGAGGVGQSHGEGADDQVA
ncbi:MAG: DUF4192 domain-containing protein [Micropruina sp.]|nr:DUF4192 domain-containing protein [Micropruina sp.]